MRSSHLLLVGLLLAVSVWFVLAFPAGPADGPSDEPRVEAPTGPRPGGPRPQEASLPDDGGAVRVEEASAAPGADATVAPLPTVDGPTAELRVRVVDGRGAPARNVDAGLRLLRGGLYVELAEDDPLAAWLERLPVQPDAQGAIVARVPAGHGVSLDFGGALWTPATRDVQALGADESVDLGEVALAPASRLGGTVRDAQGQPLAGARVDVQVATSMQWYGGRSWNAVSGADGDWQLQGLPAGRFRVETQAQGYAAAVEPGLEIERAGLEVVHDVVLERGRTVRGMVLDADRNPVPGARLFLMRAPEEGWWGDWRPPPPDGEDVVPGAVSAADGSFQLSGWLQDGRLHAVAASADGHQPGHADVEDAGATVVVTLQRHLRVSGRVVDAQGAAVPGARVRLLKPQPWGGEPSEIDNVETAADGSFRCQAQEPGDYQVSVDSAIGALVRQPLPLPRDREDLQLTVAPSTALVVAVTDADGAPLADAEVRVWGTGENAGQAVLLDGGFVSQLGVGGRFDERQRTDASGEARFAAVPAGEIRLRVSASGYERHSEDLTRRAEAQRHTVELRVGAGLVVAVSKPDGTPVRGLPVALKHADSGDEAGERQTDSAGRAVWSDLAPGAYLVAYRAQDAEGGWWRNRDNEEQELDHPLVELVAGETTVLPVQVGDLALATVVVRRGPQPAAGVLVRMELVEDAQHNRWADANRGIPTDGRGEVELQPLEPGSYDLVVKAGRDAPPSRMRVELHGGAQRLEFALDGATLRGRVLGTAGGLPGARLSLLPAAALEPDEDGDDVSQTVIGYTYGGGGMRMQMGFLAEMQSTTRSGGEGDYAFRDVPDGDWVLIARAEGYGTWTSRSIAVRGGNEVRVPDQRLLPGGVVYGRDLAHQPRPTSASSSSFEWGEQVMLLDEADQAAAMAQLGADGEYRIEDLPAGEYRLRKGSWTSEPFRLAAGATRHVDIPLPEENPR